MKKFLNLLVVALSTFIIYSVIEVVTKSFVGDVVQTALVMGCAIYVIDNAIVPMLGKNNKNHNNRS